MFEDNINTTELKRINSLGNTLINFVDKQIKQRNKQPKPEKCNKNETVWERVDRRAKIKEDSIQVRNELITYVYKELGAPKKGYHKVQKGTKLWELIETKYWDEVNSEIERIRGYLEGWDKSSGYDNYDAYESVSCELNDYESKTKVTKIVFRKGEVLITVLNEYGLPYSVSGYSLKRLGLDFKSFEEIGQGDLFVEIKRQEWLRLIVEKIKKYFRYEANYRADAG